MRQNILSFITASESILTVLGCFLRNEGIVSQDVDQQGNLIQQ
jgi:hypothetical protein